MPEVLEDPADDDADDDEADELDEAGAEDELLEDDEPPPQPATTNASATRARHGSRLPNLNLVFMSPSVVSRFSPRTARSLTRTDAGMVANLPPAGDSC